MKNICVIYNKTYYLLPIASQLIGVNGDCDCDGGKSLNKMKNS